MRRWINLFILRKLDHMYPTHFVWWKSIHDTMDYSYWKQSENKQHSRALLKSSAHTNFICVISCSMHRVYEILCDFIELKQRSGYHKKFGKSDTVTSPSVELSEKLTDTDVNQDVIKFTEFCLVVIVALKFLSRANRQTDRQKGVCRK